jgi:hypothetical protein
MIEQLLKKLIIIAGQWRDKSGDIESLEKQFEQILNELEERTGKTREQVVLTLLDYIKEKE